MDLKHTVTTTIYVSARDFDSFVNAHFGFDGIDKYFFQAAEETSEGDSKTYHVKLEAWKAWERPAAVQAGEWMYSTGTLLKIMCMNGVIDEGHYVITT